MLYIESPAGVGFSYCDNMALCNFDDDTTATGNLFAVLDFYSKFPEFTSHDLYVSGESYAGVYVPYLAYRIDQFNNQAPASQKINLKGIMVGNGVTNWEWDGDTTYVEIGYFHGLYGNPLHFQIEANNCTFLYEDIQPEDSPKCQQLYNTFVNLTT